MLRLKKLYFLGILPMRSSNDTSTNTKLIVAGAGSGKTTHIVSSSTQESTRKVLVTTFTRANEAEIRSKFVKNTGFIPSHITVQTWFTFLLQHGVRPFQGSKYKGVITGLLLSSGASALYTKEADIEKHYLTPDRKIYSDKVAKFAIKCNELSNNAVIDRLAQIYDHIYIDEVQDMAGYDLDFIKLLVASGIEVTLVGDPRQGTYSTSNSAKNKKYKKSKVVSFFQGIPSGITIDDSTLNTNFRCEPTICNLSNTLFPDFNAVAATTAQMSVPHRGVFIIKAGDVDDYLKEFMPMQLRERITSKGIRAEYPVHNFGTSKGLEFDRVLIYPTKAITDWLKSQKHESLQPTSKAKLYVAITRARLSVAFIHDDGFDDKIFQAWR